MIPVTKHDERKQITVPYICVSATLNCYLNRCRVMFTSPETYLLSAGGTWYKLENSVGLSKMSSEAKADFLSHRPVTAK